MRFCRKPSTRLNKTVHLSWRPLLFFPTICIASGNCHPETLIFQPDGVWSKPGLPSNIVHLDLLNNKESNFKKRIKRKYGKIDTGNTFYGMKMITVITSITFISTLLNMVTSNHRPNGLFPVSTIMSKGGSFQKIGEVKNVHFKKRSGWNDRVGLLNDELRKQISKSFLFSKTMFHFIDKTIR